MQIRYIHRFCAIIIGSFIIFHLGVHLTALIGPDVHERALSIVQIAYRPMVLEFILVIAIGVQIVSGLKRIRFYVKDRWARIQVLSGCYIAFFLVLHTSAALYTHHIYGIETDFFWTAGTLHYTPIKYAFALYYFLAVLAIFAHWAAALHFAWPSAPKLLKISLPVLGALKGSLIVMIFAGLFYPIEIPAQTALYYQTNFGWAWVKP